MNIQECDILNLIVTKNITNQRELAKVSGHSLGIVNRSIKNLIQQNYLTNALLPSPQALLEIEHASPRNAIILAAGFGMRMVPINTETPKGLLEIHGEPLIERLIKQLHEVQIQKIYIVVGFMKEYYEYLIDKYNVELIVNPLYASKNNLHSLKLASKYLSNSYIVPCDIWCKQNPFHRYELYSWYMVNDLTDYESSVRVNRKMELIKVPTSSAGNSMIGICYLLENDSLTVREHLSRLDNDPHFNNSFWEEALYLQNNFIPFANVVSSSAVIEINTFEQLRDLDDQSNHLQSDTLSIAATVLDTLPENITNITVLKKGMTNRSFCFDCKGDRYIMRIPGEGTSLLINREHEAEVYKVVNEKHICDEVKYLNPDNGFKLTKYLKNAHTCNPHNLEEVKQCMQKLRQFHEMHLKVNHQFDIFNQIDFYESLWENPVSVYRDYTETKSHVLSLKSYIDTHVTEKVLTHIDAVPDNFLFTTDNNGKTDIRLIDWEYAGMQDPHVDIAMFAIYSLYSREEIDNLIQLYFTEGCPKEVYIKIYCYVSVCGLLWSNWCEYKRQLGIDFGEYSLRQYRYAKDFYKIVQSELNLSNTILED